MRANVFTDGALARHAGRFVWLEIDGDKARNGAFLARFPVDAWPTLFILDPSGERAVLRFPGSATVAQLEQLLLDGERTLQGSGEGPDALLADADRAYGAGKAAEAAGILERALRSAPPGWGRRGRATESLLGALLGTGSYEPCARQALAAVPALPRSASSANSAALGLICALALPKDAPGRGELVAGLEAEVRAALAPPAIELAADDVSGLHELLAEARGDAGDEEGRRRLAAEWLRMLEAAAAQARSPEARAVFDAHRVSAAIAVGDPARALPPLLASERDHPTDYNPPARLVGVYRALGKLDEALAASDRALTRVYGPRKIRVLTDRAELLVVRGDPAGAIAALTEARAFAATLPPAQVPRRGLATVERRLRELGEQLQPAAR